MKSHFYDRILGCMIAASMGDVMGGPTEAMSTAEIKKEFGGLVDSFVDPEDRWNSIRIHRGEFTDDISQMYEMALAVADCGGNLTVARAAKALTDWAEHYPKYYPSHAGPTTRSVIEALQKGKDPMTIGKEGGKHRWFYSINSRGEPVKIGMEGGVYAKGMSNGAAMRVAPAGLVCPGDREKAVLTAMAMTAPSHGTQHGYAGACAIACGISAAMVPNAQVWDVLKSCVYGAKEGEKRGETVGRIAFGMGVPPMVERAISIAMAEEDTDTLLYRLGREVGCDISIQSSVAAAIGVFAAAGGNVKKALILAVNLGGDTDTIACISGMLAGAYSGYRSLDKEDVALIEKANPTMDFRPTAEKMADIAVERWNHL